MIKTFFKWLRTLRRCECCGNRSHDDTKGSAYCAACDGGWCEYEGHY